MSLVLGVVPYFGVQNLLVIFNDLSIVLSVKYLVSSASDDFGSDVEPHSWSTVHGKRSAEWQRRKSLSLLLSGYLRSFLAILKGFWIVQMTFQLSTTLNRPKNHRSLAQSYDVQLLQLPTS